ncbi:MAG: hypothetical protein ACTSXZ_08120, partial [Alphaproteobacteria bacterium]
LMDERRPRQGGAPYGDLIELVEDRPGHDGRYALDTAKIRAELGWRPEIDFATGLAHTVDWYLENADWWTADAGPEGRLPVVRRGSHAG